MSIFIKESRIRSLQDLYRFRIVLASLRAICSTPSNPARRMRRHSPSAHKSKTHPNGCVLLLCAEQDSNLRSPMGD